jgi:hypothetical protein
MTSPPGRTDVNWGVLGAANIATERVLPAMLEAPVEVLSASGRSTGWCALPR